MPKVSVIIPNYNHASYLPRRIESVLAQTFQDVEIIILDDHSPDNSREIIESYALQYPQIKTFFNEQNSGSPFAQWNKGAEMARGEYLWFAESDDFCEPLLLEKLVPLLDSNPNAGIAYAQTYLVDEKDEIKNSYQKNLEFIYESDAWQRPFVKSGKEACREWLLFHNPIPNASGALIRREAFMKAGKADMSMKLNGDWFLYARILSQYDLAFIPEMLNYFRVHEHTQRQRARVNGTVYQEIIRINDFIRNNVPDSADNADRALSRISHWWMGSLPRQTWTRENFKLNLKLYRFFRKYKRWVIFHILYLYLFIAFRYVVRSLGLLKPAKDLRKRLFPGKYFEY